MKTVAGPIRMEKLTVLSLSADELVVEWRADGHRSSFRIRDLRSACPCATCRTERDKLAGDPLAVMSAPAGGGPYTIEDMGPVGRYAVSFLFSDGHSSGIYAFDYLRGLCACELCKPRAGPDQ
jgi:DUF971 family protein